MKPSNACNYKYVQVLLIPNKQLVQFYLCIKIILELFGQLQVINL